MKYFYQQLVGFLSVVLVSVVVCGLLFYNVMTNNIYTQRAQQLFGYAKSIIVGQLTTDELNSSLSLMRDENISIAIFDSDNKMVYPTSLLAIQSPLTDEDILDLRNGSAINLKQSKQSFTGEPADLVTVYYPIFKDQVFNGFVAIASPISSIENEVAELRNTIIIGFASASLVGVLLSILFANYQTRRINRLRKATHEIAKGNFDISLPNNYRDEFDDLATDFNTMAASLQKSEQEVERQENLRRQFMMDVAHEMRTPLTTMNGLLEGLVHNMIPESRRARSLELITNETQRLIRLVNENLDYEKIRSDQILLVKQQFVGTEALRNVVDQLQELAQQKENELRYECAEDFTVYADYDRFIQILVNLTKNANQFTDGGHILVKGWNEDGKAIVQIIDDGIGINPKEIEAIWERFYKADVSRKSGKYGESGIGLAIVKSLVQSHHGTVQVESAVDKGTTFTVTFPDKEEKQ